MWSNIYSGVGTQAYASPEQLSSSTKHIGSSSDMYSLGIVLFELFHPFATDMERVKSVTALRSVPMYNVYYLNYRKSGAGPFLPTIVPWR